MRKPRTTLSQKRVLEKLFKTAKTLVTGSLPVSTLIRLLRKRLHMSQSQLARRAGVPQSYIAKLETGRVDPQLKTLNKIFLSLFCDIAVIPIPQIDFDEIIRQQAFKSAEKRIEYIKGTMALEDQLPDEGMIDDMIVEEQKRLIQSESNEIWESINEH